MIFWFTSGALWSASETVAVEVAPHSTTKNEAVDRSCDRLGVDHGGQRRQIDDDVVVRLARGRQQLRHLGRPDQVGLLGRAALACRRQEFQPPRLIRIDQLVDRYVVDQKLEQAGGRIRRDLAGERRTSEVRVDDQDRAS